MFPDSRKVIWLIIQFLLAALKNVEVFYLIIINVANAANYFNSKLIFYQ